MDEQILLGALAIVIGVAVGFALFVPFVAISYRRRGGLSFWRFAAWAAFLVYFWAIWTYTLLPLPDPDAIRCVGVNLDVFQFVDDIRGAIARPGNTLTDIAVLQLVLNVALFVPLGFFIRVLGGRGILTAFLVGLGVSAFIETTQLTGVWGVYPCAYRVFDVDDMLTNTIGAVLGSLLGFVVPARHRGLAKLADPGAPTPVTRGRRLLGMLCDLLGALLLQGAVAFGVQVWLQYVVGDRQAVLDGTIANATSSGVVIGLWLLIVLATGRTIGDLAVELRYAGGPLPAALARPLRFLGGMGGFLLLSLLPDGWGALAGLFALVSVILLFTTRSGRGLPGLISGQRLIDAREPLPVDAPPSHSADSTRSS